MFPRIAELGGLPINTWGLMLSVALVAAVLVMQFRAPKVGIDGDRLVPLYLLGIGGGVLGARLVHFVFAETDAFFANPLIFFDAGAGGMAFYGGAIFGVGLPLAYARWRDLPVWKLADLVAPSLMLGHAIGRLGCFFAGCCHGRVCDAPVADSLLSLRGGQVVTTDGPPFLALVFHRDVGVGSIFEQPLYPTQLWDAAAGFVLFALLSWMWKHARRFDGQVLAAMLILYPAWRSLSEGFRGDSLRGTEYLGFLSTSQLISIPVALTALVVIALRWNAGVAPETPIDPDADLDADLDDELDAAQG